jgi:hypothetical protein
MRFVFIASAQARSQSVVDHMADTRSCYAILFVSDRNVSTPRGIARRDILPF